MGPKFLYHDRLVASALCLAAFGHKVTSQNDYIVEMMKEVDEVSKTIGAPGSSPVDIFPLRSSL